MDKQNTPTKYVRITKAAQDERVWYSKKEFIGGVYEVTDHDRHRFELVHDHGKTFARCIMKSDCEPYEFPTLQTEINGAVPVNDIFDAFEEFKARRSKQDIHGATDLDLFCAGAQWMQKTQPVQEGHTITTEQLKDLYESLGEYSPEAGRELLAKIFPTVFKPERTYKTGQKFNVNNHAYLLVDSGNNHVILASLEDGELYGEYTFVDNSKAITEKEMNIITENTDYTLIE